GCTIVISFCLVIGVVAWREVERRSGHFSKHAPTPDEPPNDQQTPHIPPVPYKGRVDVKLARTSDDSLQRLNVFGALPMRQSDTFRIDAEVDPPAYVYVLWVDPTKDGRHPDVTP